MIQSLVIYSGINTDEEGVVHDDICVRQVPRNAVGDILIGRMAQEVSDHRVFLKLSFPSASIGNMVL